MTLETDLRRAWGKIKTELFYPQIPQPVLDVNTQNAVCNIESGQIKVNPDFSKEMSEKTGIDSQTTLEVLLRHEGTHYVKFPGSVLSVLKLQRAGLEVTQDQAFLEPLRVLFGEMQTNTYCLDTDLRNTSKLLSTIEGTDFYNEVALQYYDRLTGGLLGREPNDEYRPLLDELMQVNYRSKKLETSQFQSYVRAFLKHKDLVDKETKSTMNQPIFVIQMPGAGGGSSGNLQQGDGEPQPAQGDGQKEDSDTDEKSNGSSSEEANEDSGDDGSNGTSLSERITRGDIPEDVKVFTDEDIAKGIAIFAKECTDEGELNQVLDSIFGMPGEGKGVGKAKASLQPSRNIYTHLSRNFHPNLLPKTLSSNQGLYPIGQQPFEIGTPLSQINRYSSPQIMPGITKKWDLANGQSFTSEHGVPYAYIIIDNSGSMPNPDLYISPYVLAATVVANAYLKRGSKVGVHTFGGSTLSYEPSHDTDQIHRRIRQYSGGGTHFSSRTFNEDLEKSSAEFDVLVFSDMGLSNISQFVDTLKGLPESNRVELFYAEMNTYVSMLEQHFGNDEAVRLHSIENISKLHDLEIGERK